MNEPNKGLLTHEKAQELVQRALYLQGVRDGESK